MYYVYEVKVSGIRRYIGMTNDIKRRQIEHRRDFVYNSKKELYKKIKMSGVSEPITLEMVASFENKLEAERFEAYLILDDYYKRKNLWQKKPFGFRYY
jgi:predicted GIY-YIG superfamily endonuclease